MKPHDVIPKFDHYLSERGLKFEGIVIGGAALVILGVIQRETQDVDILDPNIPKEVLDAAVSFAREIEVPDTELQENWLNNGPEDMRRYLRSGWRGRIIPLFNGKALVLHTLDRVDLLGTKLLALLDRGTDWADCIALKPTADDLNLVLPWLQTVDGNIDWPKHAEQTVNELAKRLGYDLRKKL